MRGATDFGPRGGRATAQRLLADADTTRPRAECDTNHVRCRGAKSFVDDLDLSRGVVLSRAVHFCDLLRLSPLTRRFVRFRRTSLLLRVPCNAAVTVLFKGTVTVRFLGDGDGDVVGTLPALAQTSAGKRQQHA
jgi:hypothetical protein